MCLCGSASRCCLDVLLAKNDLAVVATSEHDDNSVEAYYRESKSCSPIRPEGLELWEENHLIKNIQKCLREDLNNLVMKE